MVPFQVFLLLFVIFNHTSGQAMPGYQSADSSDLPTFCSSKRLLISIVSDSLVTTFLCTWVAVHPNIPPAGECGWNAVWRRIKLMFWALVAPELILAWAVKQRHAAQEIADIYNEIKGLKPEEKSFMGGLWVEHREPRRPKAWTRIHGHFLIMGGFVLSEPDSGFASDLDAAVTDTVLVLDQNATKVENVALMSEAGCPSAMDDSKALSSHASRPSPGGSISDQPYLTKNTALSRIPMSHCDYSSDYLLCPAFLITGVKDPQSPNGKVTGYRPTSGPPVRRAEASKLSLDTNHNATTCEHVKHPLFLSEAQSSALNEAQHHPGSSTSDHLTGPTAVPPLAVSTVEGHQQAPSHPKFRVLTYGLLENLLKIKDLDFEISITEEEIQDKSKGDFLAKVLAGLQVFWFVVQCLARVAQRHDLTQLELVTLVLASLNTLMYVFWVDKPLNVAVPVRVAVKRRLTVDELRKVGPLAAKPPIVQFLIDGYVLIQKEQEDIRHSIVGITRNSPPREHSLTVSYYRVVYCWFIALPCRVLLFLVLFTVVSPAVHLTVSLFRIVFTSDIHTDALHVSTFYCPRTKKGSILHLIVMMIGGIIFSCLHQLVPYLTMFPTELERDLWSLMSYYMMLGLFGGVTAAYFLSILQYNSEVGKRIISRILRLFCMCFEFGALFIGISARFYLILLALLLLRQQPDGAFCSVDWTRVIPHVL